MASLSFLTFWKTSLLLPISLIFFFVLVSGISLDVSRKPAEISVHSPVVYSVQVINEFPHDHTAFTQSSVRKVALQTGKVEVLHKMDDSYFGEGLTLLGKRLFQVTWLKKTGFIYNQDNFSEFQTFTHQMTDGWGLATDGKILFGSDGTSTLYRIDPTTFKVINKLVVRYEGEEVHYLNELEFVNGEIWANVIPVYSRPYLFHFEDFFGFKSSF